MGVESYKVPTSEGVIPASLVENKYVTGYKTQKVWEEKTPVAEETVSTIAKYRGGNFYGFNIKTKGAAEIVFYDNFEKAEGNIVDSPYYFKEKESKFISLNPPAKFKVGLFMKIVSGEVESGTIQLDVE